MDVWYYAMAGLALMAAGAGLYSLLTMSAREALRAEIEERAIEHERVVREILARAERVECELAEEREQTREAEERIADALHGGEVL